MKLTRLLLVLAIASPACGDDDSSQPDASQPPTPDAASTADAAPTPPPSGPYDDITLTDDIDVDGLDGAVHVARDRFGIAHIHAESLGDLAFAQGYVMAHDRLPQMDILRRFAAGTLSELFGAVSQDTIETDLEMRMHRMKPLAEEAFAALQASSDPADAEVALMLQRFSDGVNAYVAHLGQGRYQLDPAAASTLPVLDFQPWTPADSLAMGRFQSFSLSWTAPLEIELTEFFQRAIEVFDESPAQGQPGFDPARDARRGASLDLLRITPVGKTAPIDGFPQPQSRKASTKTAAGRKAQRTIQKTAQTTRPRIPAALLASARKSLAGKLPMGPHAFITPNSNSNNWVVGPQHTGGKALIAGDQHLSLPNPSIFYPTHLVVPGKLEAEGVTFPGIPGVILGHNGKVAWSATVVNHDVNDVYMETIVPCSQGQGDCVSFQGAEVPIQTRTEQLRIGVFGQITETIEAKYEYVPHHGPFIPTIADGKIVPREGNTALSVRYTGHEVTHEIRATYDLLHAASVQEGMAALDKFGFGAQNWVLIDTENNFGWTTSANVPLRSAATYAWSPDNVDGNAPFLVLPGTGDFEWERYIERNRLPQALNPERGYLATANSDPVGATFDGNPLNDGTIDGRPLYVGAAYAPGLREDRINQLIQQRIDQGIPLTLDELAEIQHDSHSTAGEYLAPYLAGALAKIDGGQRTQDVIDWVNSRPAETLAQLRTAGTYVSGWTRETPPAVQGTPSEDELRDSVATTLFNVWAHFFLERSVGDEFRALGSNIHSVDENLSVRIIVALFDDPDSLATPRATETNQPILCDSMETTDVVESCDRMALEAMEQAVAWLASAEGLGSADMSTWRWGKLHTLTLRPLFPKPELNLPPSDDPEPTLRAGYPKPGDNFVVNRADSGWNDLRFTQGGGPAQRFLATTGDDGLLRVRLALPGGAIFDRASPHYRDLMDQFYFQHRHFDLPFTTPEIVSAGEGRWVLRSR